LGDEGSSFLEGDFVLHETILASEVQGQIVLGTDFPPRPHFSLVFFHFPNFELSFHSSQLNGIFKDFTGGRRRGRRENRCRLGGPLTVGKLTRLSLTESEKVKVHVSHQALPQCERPPG